MDDVGGIDLQLDRIEHVGPIQASLMSSTKQLLHCLIDALRLAIVLRMIRSVCIDIDVENSADFIPNCTHCALVTVTLKLKCQQVVFHHMFHEEVGGADNSLVDIGATK